MAPPDSADGLLPAPPRWITTLALHSRRAFIFGALTYTVLALGGMAFFWPIRIKEDFEAYLQCDGAQHYRLAAYHAATRAERNEGRRLRQETAEDEPSPPRRLQQQERTTTKWFLKLIYESRDGANIFTEGRLKQMRDVEQRILSLPSYADFCLAQGTGCELPLSVVNYFYASQDRATGDVVPDGRGTEVLPIQAILASLGSRNAYFVDRYFGVSKSGLQAALEGNITRSVFRFGLPLRGFASPHDRLQEQTAQFRKFVAQEVYPFIKGASTDEVRVHFYGDLITELEVETTVWHDARYAIGSLLFIFCYLVGHLRSFQLSFAALFCISLSFPLAYALYCMVYGTGKMIALNFLSLFVVLGVGADDVFVLSDVWTHSRKYGTGEMALARRVWSMYQKAGAAIFATSATTAASFFANLTSSIGPLRQFGFFMGACISANWIMVATLYPLVLVSYERRQGARRLRGGRWFRRCPGPSLMCTPPHGAAGGDAGHAGAEMEVSLVCSSTTTEEFCVEDPPEHGEKRFLPGGDHSTLGSEPKGALWGALVLLTVIAGVAVPGAAVALAIKDLRPAKGMPQFFPPESNLGALQELQRRFGNETTVSGTTDLRVCGGQLRSVLDCDRWRASKTSVAPSVATTAALPNTQDLDVRLEVQDYTADEVLNMRDYIRTMLAQQLNMPAGDIVVDVEVAAMTRRLGSAGDSAVAAPLPEPAAEVQLASSGSRRLAIDDGHDSIEGQPHPIELTLHFHHIDAWQQTRVKNYLRQHGDLLSDLGAREVRPQTGGSAETRRPQASSSAPAWTSALLSTTEFEFERATSTRTSSRSTVALTTRTQMEHPRRTTMMARTPPSSSPWWPWNPTVSTRASTPPALPPRTEKPAPASSSPAGPLTTATTLSPLAGLRVRASGPRGMAYDRTATVVVLWGFREAAGGSYELDPAFDMEPSEAQQGLVDLCDRIEHTRELKAFHVSCWPRDFRDFLVRTGGSFPSQNLERDLQRFVDSAPGWVKNHVGFRQHAQARRQGWRPTWLSADFRVEFDTHSGGKQTQPFMERWEAFLRDENARPHALTLGTAVPCAEVFVRAEAELRIINSALASWLVSVLCALLAVVAFTRNCWLSATATYAIFATAACSLYLITAIFKWEFGLMEAVSLIIFCGFSVDYPLHVVQAYVQERAHGAGVRQALREVSGAVVAGCATTVGAALFLLLCEIRIFTRFGQVLVVNMLLSLLFALVWIPAVLEMQTMLCAKGRGPAVGSPHNAASGSPDEAAGPPDGAAAFPLRSPDSPPRRGLVAMALRAASGPGKLPEEPPEGFAALGGGTPRGPL